MPNGVGFSLDISRLPGACLCAASSIVVMVGRTRKNGGEHMLSAIKSSSEKVLRKQDLLDPGDQLIEMTPGNLEILTQDGVELPVPRVKKVVELPQPRSWCWCSYSSHRLFFGGPATVAIARLEAVWQVKPSSTRLSVIFTVQRQLRMVRWQSTDWRPTKQEEAVEVAALAARVLAQRDRRIAELPDEARQEVAYWSGQLDRRGALEAALAWPIPAPRTVIGAYLRAVLLDEQERRGQLRGRVNLAQPNGWNDDEYAVVQAVFELQVRRYFGTGDGAGAVPALISKLASLQAENIMKQLDLGETEAMIRSALGESGVTTDDIAAYRKSAIGVSVMGVIHQELDLYPTAVDLLIARSEQLAFDRGWHPPLLLPGVKSRQGAQLSALRTILPRWLRGRAASWNTRLGHLYPASTV